MKTFRRLIHRSPLVKSIAVLIVFCMAIAGFVSIIPHFHNDHEPLAHHSKDCPIYQTQLTFILTLPVLIFLLVFLNQMPEACAAQLFSLSKIILPSSVSGRAPPFAV